MNRARRSRLHTALFLGVGLAATGLGLVAYGTNVFRELDLQSVDARFTVRGTEPAPRDIVVVKIDDVTFGVAQRQFEQFRPLHAQVITKLKADGAKVIAYDVQFTEPAPVGFEEHDNLLIEAVAKVGNVVLATTEVGPNGETGVFGGDDVVPGRDLRDGFVLGRLEGPHAEKVLSRQDRDRWPVGADLPGLASRLGRR